jgi:hypothetical protein
MSSQHVMPLQYRFIRLLESLLVLCVVDDVCRDLQTSRSQNGNQPHAPPSQRVKKPGCGTEKAHPRCERRPHDTPTMEQLDIDHAMKLSNVGEDERISLWNPVSGARLSGMAAPMLRNLPTWLKRNPGWQPVEKGPDGTP